MKLKLKKGDHIIVIAGKNKGKKGKILSVNRDKMRVIVEGVNLVKRHMKPTQQFQGGIIEKPAPLATCKVMLVCPKCSKPSRVGHKKVEDKNLRFCKKCEEIIDKV